HQRTISRDLKREIILRLTRIQTIKDIAHDLFISEASVQRVLLCQHRFKIVRNHRFKNVLFHRFKCCFVCCSV
ncbi:hypothetical protein, partial [Limosilactobacillus reuteri]|uniref:hypothetical protein n=1 Tax=Limosilactobacillus reuteri TaxID=1598 RepID=UPI002072FC63